MNMTFREFQATGVVRRLAEVPGYGDDLATDSPVLGVVYLGRLCIEDCGSWPGIRNAPLDSLDRGQWYLAVGDAEHTADDRSVLEEILYEHAVAEGMATRFDDMPGDDDTPETFPTKYEGPPTPRVRIPATKMTR
jgi:hypothetical protein